MTNPTTYFGWQMPTAVDLVTDLPADFEVFGQAVDTDFQDLLGGTTGQVLSKTSATDMDFTWATPSSGKVLQVLSTNKLDTFTSTSTSPVDVTGLSVSITPSSASSKILIFSQIAGDGLSGSNAAMFRLMRGATDILVPTGAGSRTTGALSLFAGNVSTLDNGTIVYLDSPASTSATTYKIQGFASTSGSFYVNRSSNDSNSSAYMRGVSTITAMEIGA